VKKWILTLVVGGVIFLSKKCAQVQIGNHFPQAIFGGKTSKQKWETTTTVTIIGIVAQEPGDNHHSNRIVK